MEAVHCSLISKGFVKARRRVYNDLDNSMYYIPHKEKRIMVWGSQSNKKLVVLQPNFVHGMCVHVRRIWPRCSMKYGFNNLLSLRSYAKNDYNGEYGDCRDKGYILSYGNLSTNSPGKIDRAYAYWPEFANFMLDLRFAARDLDLNINQLMKKGVE